DLITTAPTVIYQAKQTNGEMVTVSNPSALPDAEKREYIEEPFVRIEMICPKEYVGTLMDLAQTRRGDFKDMTYLNATRSSLVYEMPLAEVVSDFFDEMKSRSRGYASMEYSLLGFRRSNLAKLDIKINGEVVDPLATIVHKDDAQRIGRLLTKRLKTLIPRAQFKIPIQAAIGVKVVASEAISAMRKDVLAKCYGGDVSRKKKLLKKQAAGKKRMKSLGSVNVPQEAFMAVLSMNEEAEKRRTRVNMTKAHFGEINGGAWAPVFTDPDAGRTIGESGVGADPLQPNCRGSFSVIIFLVVCVGRTIPLCFICVVVAKHASCNPFILPERCPPELRVCSLQLVLRRLPARCSWTLVCTAQIRTPRATRIWKRISQQSWST
ncbi:hypothetical protein CYMTET_11737, partial [Cymbomonas tetramitiformis]